MANPLIGNSPNFTEQGDPPCSQVDPEIFFSQDNQTVLSQRSAKKSVRIYAIYRNEKEAKAICAKCPYKFQCLEFAVKDNTLEGIWGGTTERERVSIRRMKTIRSK